VIPYRKDIDSPPPRPVTPAERAAHEASTDDAMRRFRESFEEEAAEKRLAARRARRGGLR